MSNPTGAPSSGNRRDAAISAGRRTLEIEASALTHRCSRARSVVCRRPVDRIRRARAGRLVCTGMGKSGHVARKIAATLASTGRRPLCTRQRSQPRRSGHDRPATTRCWPCPSPGEVTGARGHSWPIPGGSGIPVIGLTASARTARSAGPADIRLLQWPRCGARPQDDVQRPDHLHDRRRSPSGEGPGRGPGGAARLRGRGLPVRSIPAASWAPCCEPCGDLMHGASELPLISPDAPMSRPCWS
jgi:arabinose-5-phosphate isomerase